MIKTISDDFFNKAMAFLEVAIISSKEKENIYFHTAEYSNVTAYLVYHATELFLKFAIFQASKKLVEGHDIFKLYEKYKKCYSDEKLKIIKEISDKYYNSDLYKNHSWIGKKFNTIC